MEYPGLWRYYRHLPQDLDSSTLCALVVGTHPWIMLGRNVPRMLANRDGDGRFMTWVLEEDEPDVVPVFRIEADPVVNANVIACLGDRPETRDAQQWLKGLIAEGTPEGLSKWYPDTIAVYYATTRAMTRARSALSQLGPVLADRILALRDEQGRVREHPADRPGGVGARQHRQPRPDRRETPGREVPELPAGGRQLAGAARIRRPVVAMGASWGR